MNKDLLKKDIALLLEAISEQFMTIHQHQGKIPRIELDIVLNNVRNLYERLQQLNKANDQFDAGIKSIDVNKLTEADIITAAIGTLKNEKQQEKVITAIETAKDNISVDEKIIVAASLSETKVPEPEMPAPQPKLTTEEKREAVKINIQEQVAVNASTEEEKKNPKHKKAIGGLFDAPPTIGEQFEGQPSLKDKLATSKTETSIAEKLHRNKINDLKTAIGINERFGFINELFEGNMQPYTETIERLNQATDINHALQMMDSFIAKYEWKQIGRAHV